MSSWKPISSFPQGKTELCLVIGVWNGEINGKDKSPSINLVIMRGGEDSASVIGTDAYSATVEDITHWMPIPELPNG